MISPPIRITLTPLPAGTRCTGCPSTERVRHMACRMEMIGMIAMGPMCGRCWQSFYEFVKTAPQGVEITEVTDNPEGK